MNDMVQIKADIEKLTRHVTGYQKNHDELFIAQKSQGEMLKRIEHALIGNEMNKNMGMVKDLSDAQDEIEKLKDTILVHKVYFFLMGVIIIGSGILAWAGKLILK